MATVPCPSALCGMKTEEHGSWVLSKGLCKKQPCKFNTQRMPWGGGKGRGVENLTNDTPPKKGFCTPPPTVRFPPPSGVSALFFLYKNPRQSRPEALLEGSKNFRESAFSGTFCPPPYVLHPPISPPKTRKCSCQKLATHVQLLVNFLRARFCTRSWSEKNSTKPPGQDFGTQSCSKNGQLLVNSLPTPHPWDVGGVFLAIVLWQHLKKTEENRERSETTPFQRPLLRTARFASDLAYHGLETTVYRPLVTPRVLPLQKVSAATPAQGRGRLPSLPRLVGRGDVGVHKKCEGD